MTVRQCGALFVGSVFIVLAGHSGQARGVHIASVARDDQRTQYNGTIDDHTIAMAGSWTVGGVWTLTVQGSSGKADFSAALTMERSDLWFVMTPNPPADPNSLPARNAHTHHISLTDGLVTTLVNGFRVSGPATLTGNGATPPFGTSSTVQVDITGGDLVASSNIALSFGGDAVKHFGANPLSGVVSGLKKIE